MIILLVQLDSPFIFSKMPSYKVIYFNVKALAEPMRMILSYGKIDFEDERIERENWPALKPSMPMGQMPILEVDGKKMHQSVAMSRYLAKQVGLTGADAWEDLQIDIVVDTVNDFRQKIAVASYEPDEAVKAKKFETVKGETIPFYLEKLEAIAKENNGHLALGKLTWADFFLAGLIDYMNYMAGINLTEKTPYLQKVIDNVLSIEQVKKWVEKRPVTDL